MARDARDFRGLVFDDGTGLLGLVHYVFHPNLWRDEGVCYLQDLFTDPQARGRGVARGLIEAEDLSPEDLKRPTGEVLPRLHGALLKNEQDVALFERLAFLARRQR